MPRGKGRRLLRALREGGKVLLSSVIGVLSLAVNFYLVWTGQDWTGRPYYDLYKDVITVTAATAAVGIAIVIYSPEVVKVFGETFLAKRYAAGREDGLEEGVEKGRGEGRVEGRVEGREERDAEVRAELRRLLADNPETVAERLQDWLGKGDAPYNGKGPGPAQPG